MITTNSSAQEPKIWYMDFQPIFERSYGALEDGKTVQKTESLSPEEVDEIILSLSSDAEFVSLAQRYTSTTTDAEEETALGNEMRAYVDKSIKSRQLTLDYFFSFMIWLEFIRRFDSGKIGVEK